MRTNKELHQFSFTHQINVTRNNYLYSLHVNLFCLFACWLLWMRLLNLFCMIFVFKFYYYLFPRIISHFFSLHLIYFSVFFFVGWLVFSSCVSVKITVKNCAYSGWCFECGWKITVRKIEMIQVLAMRTKNFIVYMKILRRKNDVCVVAVVVVFVVAIPNNCLYEAQSIHIHIHRSHTSTIVDHIVYT